MRLAITGHRPADLAGWTKDGVMHQMTRFLNSWQDVHQEDLVTEVHTGGALGTDQWAAEAVQRLGTWQVIHLPFTEDIMTRPWKPEDRANLVHLIEGFNTTPCEICPKPFYSTAGYQRRNEHMVDSADHVLAFWTGKRHGGTWNAIAYAHSVGKPVWNALDGYRRIKPG